jgi:hypothetical protein
MRGRGYCVARRAAVTLPNPSQPTPSDKVLLTRGVQWRCVRQTANKTGASAAKLDGNVPSLSDSACCSVYGFFVEFCHVTQRLYIMYT